MNFISLTLIRLLKYVKCSVIIDRYTMHLPTHTLPPYPNFPGDLPYQDIPMPNIVARVISGYRLPKPEHASEEV